MYYLNNIFMRCMQIEGNDICRTWSKEDIIFKKKLMCVKKPMTYLTGFVCAYTLGLQIQVYGAIFNCENTPLFL